MYRFMLTSAVITLAFLTSLPVGTKGECVDYSEFAHWSGGIDTPGDARNVAVAGDFAYIADGDQGLTIIDVSDPTAPVHVSTISTYSPSWDVAVVGDYAYLACGINGIVTVDVSNPAAPIALTFYPVEGFANGIEAGPDALYLISVRMGVDGRLTAFDLVEPSDPQHRGQVWTPREPVKVIVEGSIVYVADTICFKSTCGGGLGAYDVSDIDDPVELGYVATGPLTGADVQGNIAYVCTRTFGLWKLNVANPSAMQLLANLPEIVVEDVVIDRDLAYMANEGLQIADFGRSLTTYTLVDLPTPPRGFVRGLDLTDDRAYLVDNGTLQIVRIERPETLPAIGEFDTPGRANALVVDRDIAYVADGSDGLQVIDVSDAANPTLLTSVDGLPDAVDIDVVGNYAYIADNGRGLAVIDIQDPAAATLVATQRSVGLTAAVVAQPPYAYVTDVGDFEQQGFRVFDVSDPTTPTRVAGFRLDDDARDLAISGTTAYLALDGMGVGRVDISDPLNPVFLDRFAVGNGAASSICVLRSTHPQGGITYGAVVGSDLGLVVLNLDAPSPSAVIATLSLPGNGISITQFDDYFAVGTDANQVILVSLDNPYQPIVLGGFNTNGMVFGVDGAKQVFVAQGEAGLACFPTLCRDTPVDVDVPTAHTLQLVSTPNPFYPTTRITFGLAAQSPVTLRVYDTSGRLVRTLLDGARMGAGPQTAVWDGHTSAGSPAAPGMYMYTLQTAGRTVRGKAVKLR